MDYKAISQQAGLKEKRVRIYGYYKNKYTLKRKKHEYEKREVRWPKHYVREQQKTKLRPLKSSYRIESITASKHKIYTFN